MFPPLVVITVQGWKISWQWWSIYCNMNLHREDCTAYYCWKIVANRLTRFHLWPYKFWNLTCPCLYGFLTTLGLTIRIFECVICPRINIFWIGALTSFSLAWRQFLFEFNHAYFISLRVTTVKSTVLNDVTFACYDHRRVRTHGVILSEGRRWFWRSEWKLKWLELCWYTSSLWRRSAIWSPQGHPSRC